MRRVSRNSQGAIAAEKHAADPPSKSSLRQGGGGKNCCWLLECLSKTVQASLKLRKSDSLCLFVFRLANTLHV